MNKGNYYKLRTKKWLEKKGYSVAIMEKMFRIFNRQNPEKIIYTKTDQMGSDLLAMNSEQLIFVQVKYNTARGKVNEAIREFAKYPFPDFVDRWIVIWEPKGREPEIVEV